MTRRKRTPPPAVAGSNGVPAATAGAGGSEAAFRIPASLQQLSALSASLARIADKPAEEKNSAIVRAAQAQAQAQAALGFGFDGAGRGSGGKGDGGNNKAKQQQQQQQQQKSRKELKWKTDQKVFPEAQTWVRPKAGAAVSGHATFMQRRFLEGQVRAAEEEGGEKVGGQGEINGGSASGASGSPGHAAGPPLRVLMDGRVSGFPPSDAIQTTAMGRALWGGDDSDGGGPRKKRRIEFVERHQPEFPSSQIWVKAKPRGAVSRTYGGDIEARRQAIIAQLRQTHSPVAIVGVEDDAADSHPAATGRRGGGVAPTMTTTRPMSTPTPTHRPGAPETTVAGARQQREGSAPNEEARNGGSLEFSKHQSEIAALIAQKRAQNEASGQMQRLLGLRSEHQRKQLGQHQERHNGVHSPAVGQPPHTVPRAAQHRGGPLLAPRPMPLHGVAQAPVPSLPPFPAMGIGGHTGEEDSDEDAPGEEDTPPSAPAPVPPSVQVPAVASAVPPTLNTDPGDLRSLFSSPGPSTPHPEQQQSAAAAGVVGGTVQGDDTGQNGDEPESPSAQLLMALANASTPPPPAPSLLQPAADLGGGHRRTRSGFV